MRQFITIFKFELFGYLKNKIYIGISLFVILAIAVVLSVPSLNNLFNQLSENQIPNFESEIIGEPNDNNTENNYIPTNGSILLVNLTDKDYLQVLSNSLNNFAWVEKNAEEFGDDKVSELKNIIDNGEYEYAILIENPLFYRIIANSFSIMDMTQSNISAIMTDFFKSSTLLDAGVSPDTISTALNNYVQSETIETGKSQFSSFFHTYILMFMLYMAILLYGQMVATSVASEKSSRAMELLITSSKPNNLMFGKVLGTGTAGLLQMGSIFIFSFIFYRINIKALGQNEIISSIFGMDAQTLAYTLIFFLLGFFLYSFLFAALGSLAARTEDINTSIMPVIFLFIGAFIVSFYSLMGNVESPLTIIASYVPFTSPMVMFVRVSMADVALWKVGLSIVILIACNILFGVIAAKIYRIGVLMYGKSPRIRELIKILKMSK